MRRKKTGSGSRPLKFKTLTSEQIADKFKKQKLQDRERSLSRKLSSAVSRFRPRKSDRGRIIFIGVKGDRTAAAKGRRGYAIYVNSKGKKIPVRAYDRSAGKCCEKVPSARKISSIDVSRVKSKKAKKEFFTAYTNEITKGKLESIPKSGRVKSGKVPSVPNGTIHTGSCATDRIDLLSGCVKKLARGLKIAVDSSRGTRNFLVTIGVCVQAGKDRYFVSTQARFSRTGSESPTITELVQFFGKVVYGFLANELAGFDLVLSGSARHISRLKENRGKKRKDWTKDGFLWQGHDMKDVTLEKVEWRFDRLSFK